MSLEAMTCRELSSAAMRLSSLSVEALSRDDEAGLAAGAILQSNSCRRTVKLNVSLNAKQTLSQTDLTSAKISAKQSEPKQPSDSYFQTAHASAREAESSRMSMLAKVLLRDNSLVFFGAKLPMLQQVIKNVNKYFYHHAVGWFVG